MFSHFKCRSLCLTHLNEYMFKTVKTLTQKEQYTLFSWRKKSEPTHIFTLQTHCTVCFEFFEYFFLDIKKKREKSAKNPNYLNLHTKYLIHLWWW